MNGVATDRSALLVRLAPIQHMLNRDRWLATDPPGLTRRTAELLDLDAERLSLWMFARCAQEALHDVTMREPARRLAP